MRLALIPARGGSKRIPRKNVRPFGGRPMIAHAIDVARRSQLFDRIVVSTDDEEIAQVAVASGAEVPFRRPAHLADDHTPTVPVIAHGIEACRQLGWDPQQVCCIYPAVPLLQPQDLQSAHHALEAGTAAYAFAVVAFESPIQRALRRAADGAVQPFHPEYANTRTQDLEPAFFDAGQFYWGRCAAWLSGLTIHLNAVTCVLPSWRAVDIDTPDDWERAERLYAHFSAK